MTLFVGVVIFFLVLNVWGQYEKTQASSGKAIILVNNKYAVTRLPDTYKDIFKPGSAGRPTLGTMSSTCWARGGICVEIRECPSLIIDVAIAGCSWGHKVCCKIQKFLTPTVGIARRENIPVIKNKLEDLGVGLQIIAYRNSMALSLNKDSVQDERSRETYEDSVTAYFFVNKTENNKSHT